MPDYGDYVSRPNCASVNQDKRTLDSAVPAEAQRPSPLSLSTDIRDLATVDLRAHFSRWYRRYFSGTESGRAGSL